MGLKMKQMIPRLTVDSNHGSRLLLDGQPASVDVRLSERGTSMSSPMAGIE